MDPFDHPPRILGLLLALLLGSALCAPGAAQLPPGAPWLVSSTETRSNETIRMDRALIVAPGGTLRLEETVIEFGPGASILVSPGGALELLRSTLRAADEAPPYPFLVMGRIEADASRIEGSEGLILRGFATAGSRMEATTLAGNANHGVQLTLRASLTLHGSVIQGNGHDASTAPSGVRVSDSTLFLTDSVFLENAGWALRLVATSAGAQVMGPSVSRVHGNVFANGEGGVHIQGGEARTNAVESNLFTRLDRALNLQGPGHANLSRNTIVENGVAASNFGYGGMAEPMNTLGNHTVSLGESWLGPEGAVWEGPNRLQGPFDVTGLVDEDPVAHLWERLEAALVVA